MSNPIAHPCVDYPLKMADRPTRNYVSRRQDFTICIVQPNEGSISETFIKAHADRLPCRVAVVHGDVPQLHGAPILSQNIAAIMTRRMVRSVVGASGNFERTLAHMKAFRRLRPALVLAEYGTTGVDVMNACRRCNVPLLVHFHGFDASRKQLLLDIGANYRKLFEQAAGVVAVSREMELKLLELGVHRDKLHYNPYGVDCDRFDAVDAGTNPARFVAVGRLTDKKAPHLTIIAFAHVLERCPDVRLSMIGDGPLRGVCRDLVKSLKIEHAVELLGAQPHDVVCQRLSTARCFVQHSLEAEDGDREGTPVSILEAGACGLPVVATRHAGIPDVVQEGETGLLVDEWDVTGMTTYMERLANDAALATRLGCAARDRIESHFSMERHIDQLSAIVSSCIHGAKT